MTNRLDAVTARKYTDKNGEGKTAYTRIGTAWAFKEGNGWTVRLEAIPAPQDGEFTILLFEPKPRNDTRQQSNDFGREETNAIQF